MNEIDEKNVGVSTKTVFPECSFPLERVGLVLHMLYCLCRRGNVHMPQCIAAPSIFATGIGGLAFKGEEEDHQGPGGQPGTILRGSTGSRGWVLKKLWGIEPPLKQHN